MKYAIIDVETTGGLAKVERITEIAIVLHDGEKTLDTFSTLINPGRSIPWSITQITGITDEMVAHAPKFFEVAKKIVEMTEDTIFVAHNVSFDYSFIRSEFERLGYVFTRKQLCTVKLARMVFPGLPSYSLSNLKKHFGIVAEKSHRALDDTLATVKIFEMIMAEQNGQKSAKSFINQGIKESKLPAGITLERLNQLPEACGVYYLHDAKGEVIYVGKSLNIKKRIFEHFADLTQKGEKMREGVADISHEITGSELVALLHESGEIKRLLPRINRAQRTRNFPAGIFSYFDQNGYRCFAIGKMTDQNRKTLDLVADYPKLDSAKNHLQSLARQFELCQKLCNLEQATNACFHFSIKQCRGACVGHEPASEYNLRASLVHDLLFRRLQGSFFIIEPGRTTGENAVICVENGNYKGFGFFEDGLGPLATEDLLEAVTPLEMPNPEAAKIIRGFLDSSKVKKVVKF